MEQKTIYYITDPTLDKGFEEVTEQEFYALNGDEETRPYVGKVYRGEMSIEEVPENLQEKVQAVVNNRIAKYGTYAEQPVPAQELKDMIDEVV